MSDPTSSPDEPEPPRREFRFKDREFERDNRPLDQDDNQPAIDVRSLYKQAGTPAPKPKQPAPPAENEVHAILRANVARATEAGDNDLELKPKRMSRRNRDYWTLFVLGNGFIAVAMLLFTHNLIAVLGSIAAMLIFTVALTWVMRFVMDDY